jgi:hypothetical protein
MNEQLIEGEAGIDGVVMRRHVLGVLPVREVDDRHLLEVPERIGIGIHLRHPAPRDLLGRLLFVAQLISFTAASSAP